MYKLTLGEITFPVAPSTINISQSGKNQTIDLINDMEVSIVKLPALREVSFEVELPYKARNYSIYENGFRMANYYIKIIKSYMDNRTPINFTIVRQLPNQNLLHQTSFLVTLESYTTKDVSEKGFDIYVSISLKEYKRFETKKVTTYKDGSSVLINAENNRDATSSPNPTTPISYVVKSGDTLWDIAKKYYGDGSKYTVIATENNISNPNMLSTSDIIVIPVLS